MGTTPVYAIPYVEPTDLLANFPAADKAKADRLEALFGTQLIMAAAYRAANYSPAPGTDIPCAWDTFPISDPSITYSGQTFTLTKAGTYAIDVSMKWERNTANPTSRVQSAIQRNAAIVQIGYMLGNGTTYQTLTLAKKLRCAANDTITIVLRSNATGDTLLGDALATNVSIVRLGA